MPYALGGLALIAALLGWLLLEKTEELGAVTAEANGRIEALAVAQARSQADADNARERMAEHRDLREAADERYLSQAAEVSRMRVEIDAKREQRFFETLASPFDAGLDHDTFFSGLFESAQAGGNQNDIRTNPPAIGTPDEAPSATMGPISSDSNDSEASG